MNRDLEHYYNVYFDLFRSDGWKQMIEELSENAENVSSIESIKDQNDLYFRKGQLNVLGHIINLESITLSAYEDALQEEEDD